MAGLRTTPLPDGFFGAYVGDQKAQDAHESRAAAARRKQLDPCETCGRGVAPGKGWIVIVTGGGSSALHPDDDTDEAQRDSGYMGGYVVGSTCIKQIPAEFRVPYVAV